MDEVIKYGFSFLGGGVIAGLISWARIAKSEREARRSDYIRQQLENLYGPVYFFASQNEKLFALSRKFLGAYSEWFEGKNWSPERQTQKNLEEQSASTIDIANHYITIVTENNEEIMRILRQNAQYMDAEDVEVFQDFAVHHLRLNTERDEEGKLKTPFMIYRKVGNISFMKQEFIEFAKSRFGKKSDSLKRLR